MGQPDHIAGIQALVRGRIERAVAVKQELLLDDNYQKLVIQVAMRITESLNSGGKVLFCGNGGSAADAQHLAAELPGDT